MNLRQTITGAAVALGSATVMLGLGGIAHADTAVGAASTPDLGGQLGDIGGVGDLASLDTTDPTGKIRAVNTQDPSVTTNLDAGANGIPAAPPLGLSEPQGQPHVGAGLDI